MRYHLRLGRAMGSTDTSHRNEPAGRVWWIPLAAVSALAVVVALVTAVILGQRDQEPSAAAAPLTSRIGLAARAAFVALGSDADEFENARAELLQAFDAREEEMPEETRATVAQNLEIIEGQIAAISVELGRDPDNRRLARLLAVAYQRELELLQRAAALRTRGGATDDS
jgi:hypothetical protein